MRISKSMRAGAAMLACAGAACAQTARDSGWVPLFNGADLQGLEVQIKDKPKGQDPDKVFTVEDGMIHAYAGFKTVDYMSPQGYVITPKEYSRYRVRLEYRFVDRPGTGGSGLEYHVHEGTFWPRCLECQTQRGYAGDYWLLSGVGAKDAAGKVYAPAPYTQIVKTARLDKDFDWNWAEVLVMAADSSVHRINGTVNNRAYQFTQLNASNQVVPLTQGKVLVQAEGQEMWVRRWEIMELDAAGRPLNATTAVRRGAGLAWPAAGIGKRDFDWPTFQEAVRGRIVLPHSFPDRSSVPGSQSAP